MQNVGQFKVGDKFKVVKADNGWEVGDIITLEYDDGSSIPKFIDEEGKSGWMELGSEVVPLEVGNKLYKLVKESPVGEVGSIFELIEGHTCVGQELYKLVKGVCTYNNAPDGTPGAWIHSHYLEPYVEEEYKIGDKFRVIGNTSSHGFEVGDVVTLVEQPLSDMPGFKKDEKGYRYWMNPCDVEKMYASENNMITIPCPEGYIFDGVRELNKGDFKLLLDSMTVEEWRSEHPSCGTYIVLKKAVPETLEGFIDVPAKFERVPGLTIDNGLFFTDDYNDNPVKWEEDRHTFEDDIDNTKIWKLVN